MLQDFYELHWARTDAEAARWSANALEAGYIKPDFIVQFADMSTVWTIIAQSHVAKMFISTHFLIDAQDGSEWVSHFWSEGQDGSKRITLNWSSRAVHISGLRCRPLTAAPVANHADVCLGSLRDVCRADGNARVVPLATIRVAANGIAIRSPRRRARAAWVAP